MCSCVRLCTYSERATADEYIDFVTHVLAAANELLLDKLKQVCSAVLRSFGMFLDSSLSYLHMGHR